MTPPVQSKIFLRISPEQFYAAYFKLYGSCITFITVNNVLTNLYHREYSKCPLLARMQAWMRVRHWFCNDIVNNALLCSIDGSIKCTTFISRVCLSLYQSFHLFSASIMSKQLYISSNFSHRLVNTPLYTVFHKIGTPSYFCNNFFKC